MKCFIISVDTEADDAWARPDKISLNNFNEIPRFQELCEQYDVIPTYLLTYEYATHQPAIAFFKQKAEQGKCEIGHHLHVWTTPPFQDEVNGVDMAWLQAYQYELPDDMFKAKADALYEAIDKNCGIAPESHRAGRWGVDGRTIDWLYRKGFKVDSSVVPFVNYSRNRGKSSDGPDFSALEYNKPYAWKTQQGSEILEAPVSVLYEKTPVISTILSKNKYLRLLEKKLNPRVILRPNPKYPLSDLEKIMRQDRPYLQMMLHSSELCLNCSPYTKSLTDYQQVWKQIELVFTLSKELDYKPIMLKSL